MEAIRDLVARLADREGARSEATIQADVRTLLLTAPLHLDAEDLRDVTLESPVGDRRRIDVETGFTVLEVKRDLRRSGVREDALQQLAGYVQVRELEMERRYVGVLTDGAEWRCYYLTTGELAEASAITVRKAKPDVDALLVWLEGVLATAQEIPPTPREIEARLGAGSSSHALDRASLADLYAAHREVPSVEMKRQLWARLLTTALGSQFKDSDELFVEHTLLVNTAEIIAHAVLGLDIQHLSPGSLLTGSKFAEHGIHGVVEPDFFDWVVDVGPKGDAFIRTLARRLARFDWSAVEHDVLKVLYESVIGRETRKKLGEYYTPDWLAEAMVEATVVEPLSQRVLDPACGSGTFIFHAVRSFLRAAEDAGWRVAEALEKVSSHVLGMDLHPVAVTLARVTYVLALGPERLADPSRRTIHVPVYLGDSMQWQKSDLELLTGGYLVIQVDGNLDLFGLELRFPESLLEDAGRFDQLVDELATRATERKASSPVPSLRSVFQRFAVPDEDQSTLKATFAAMCRLHDEGRDHIWGYYVRNLSRPVWLAQPRNRVDTLIGNPPWLAYRHMPGELQERFREMSDSRGLWHGARVATQQDLSGLFVARAIQLYLKRGGGFGFVMPNAALDRAQFRGFRAGTYPDPREPVEVEFERPWDLRRIRPHFFPRGAGVVFGRRAAERSRKLPTKVEVWKGHLGGTDASWEGVVGLLERRPGTVQVLDKDVASPYRERFRNGATVFPRVLFLVEERPAGPLGLPHGTKAVRSVRSAYEKPPWRMLDSHEGVVESEFVLPVFLGEHIVPYRNLPPAQAVLPWEQGKLLHGDHPRLDLYPWLAKWWRRAAELWVENRSSERLLLVEQLDYHGKLSSQYPVARSRVVYAKAGMHLCAARIEDPRAVVDHTLYWAAVAEREEAEFLCAILNSAKVTELVRPLMSYGKDERHIDKHVWRLPIPRFDRTNELHSQLATLGGELEAEIGQLDLDEGKSFISLRRQLRRFLKNSPTGQEVEELVEELLS